MIVAILVQYLLKTVINLVIISVLDVQLENLYVNLAEEIELINQLVSAQIITLKMDKKTVQNVLINVIVAVSQQHHVIHAKVIELNLLVSAKIIIMMMGFH